MSKTCIYCKETKLEQEFVRYKTTIRNECKRCKANAERKRRQNRSEQEQKELNQRNYKRQKELLPKRSTDQLINLWCTRQLKRKNLNRSSLSREFLIDQCKLARRKFKYIVFDLSQTRYRGLLASIDRIDSSKGYTEDNIQVIPLWLNSAKLDLPIDYLHELMESYLEYIHA